MNGHRLATDPFYNCVDLWNHFCLSLYIAPFCWSVPRSSTVLIQSFLTSGIWWNNICPNVNVALCYGSSSHGRRRLSFIVWINCIHPWVLGIPFCYCASDVWFDGWRVTLMPFTFEVVCLFLKQLFAPNAVLLGSLLNLFCSRPSAHWCNCFIFYRSPTLRLLHVGLFVSLWLLSHDVCGDHFLSLSRVFCFVAVPLFCLVYVLWFSWFFVGFLNAFHWQDYYIPTALLDFAYL